MSGPLEGKIAVVTGASGGQGRAVVARYLRDGAEVIAVDLEVGDDLDMGRTGRLIPFPIDITSLNSGHRLSEQLAAAGGCDVLYNNAGIYLPGRGDGPAGELDMTAWGRTIAVNLTGAVHMINAVLPAMLNSGGGVVLNVASLAGIAGSRNMAYTASKAALIGVTKSLAFTHGSRGIRSVALSLGVISTGMMDHAREDESRWGAILESIPLGRAAEPSEIAAWASFLASDEASYANGSNIVIDGGRGIGI